jgi:hypothetical protein
MLHLYAPRLFDWTLLGRFCSDPQRSLSRILHQNFRLAKLRKANLATIYGFVIKTTRNSQPQQLIPWVVFLRNWADSAEMPPVMQRSPAVRNANWFSASTASSGSQKYRGSRFAFGCKA